MADKNIGEASTLLEFTQEVEHLRLHGNIHGADTLITYNELRLDRKSAGNT